MFEGTDFNKSLDEELFDSWLENGRESKLNHTYLLIIWDELESDYRPVYLGSREEIYSYKKLPGRELLVAAYDLYSESRIV